MHYDLSSDMSLSPLRIPTLVVAFIHPGISIDDAAWVIRCCRECEFDMFKPTLCIGERGSFFANWTSHRTVRINKDDHENIQSIVSHACTTAATKNFGPRILNISGRPSYSFAASSLFPFDPEHIGPDVIAHISSSPSSSSSSSSSSSASPLSSSASASFAASIGSSGAARSAGSEGSEGLEG
jgi:hypothetical protein